MADRSIALPSVPLPSDTVEVAGQAIEIKSLSRSDALKLTTQFRERADDAEIFVLARGVGVTEEQAKEWRDETDPITAGKVIDAILILTGIVDSSKG